MSAAGTVKYIAGSVTVVVAIAAVSIWSLVQRSDDEVIVVETGSKFISLPMSLPSTLHIPKLGLTAPFAEPIGLLPSGELSVPLQSDTVAYYQHAPTPGEIGPAIIVGHTYDQFQPAAFAAIVQLDKGDTLSVSRSDGVEALFAVTEVSRNIVEEFSTEAVYGELPYAGIRLLACGDVEGRESVPCVIDSIVFGQLIATSSVR
jgi:hypothetical protein